MGHDKNDEQTLQCVTLMREVWDEIRASPVPGWASAELSISQSKAMIILSRGQLSMKDLATALGVGTSSATHIIDRLVDKGLVQRSDDPADRRLVLCSLTEAGEQWIDDKAKLDTEELRTVAELLDAEQLNLVSRSMSVLATALQKRREKTLATSQVDKA